MTPTSIVVLGPPNTGKSHMAASIAEIVDPSRVMLLALRPKELQSGEYQRHNFPWKCYFDENWVPDLDSYVASGFKDLLRDLRNLYTSSDYDAVIIDPLTDAFDLASHSLLAQERISTPGDLPGKGPLRYYGDLRKKCQEIVKRVTLLTVGPHPKWVICPMHTRPADDGVDLNQGKPSQSKKAKGVRFEGDILPMLDGSYRYDMIGEFTVKLYTHVDIHFQRGVTYQVQVQADTEKFAGLGMLPHDADGEKFLPNHLPTILKGRKE